jgi:uncharacterized protein YbjT (DUF2867 family)
MTMTTVVTGATGCIGRAVVNELVRAGEPVRAVTRHPAAAGTFPPGVKVYPADLHEPDTLAVALRGARRLHLFPVPQTARVVVDQARAAGVDRIVVLSSGAVTAGYDTNFHPPVERAVEESGVEWTHIRPGEFAMNKLRLWGPSIRAGRVVIDPYPEQIGVPIHEVDVAAVAAAALLRDGHAGKAYTLTGPQALTHRQQVRAIEAAIGADITIDQVSAEQAREHYRRQGGWAAANADFLLGFHAYAGTPADDPVGTPPTQTILSSVIEQVTGKPARTFSDWALDHTHDFNE